MGVETGFFVQFPHPGGEHNPRTHDMPWNTADHRRKFLIGRGRYADTDDQIRDADLVFWGEWEPPSIVERRWPASGRLPRALHRPWWAEPSIRGPRQNTDPWVFGERMVYSNCKQITGPERRATSMQRLTRGSVICFGSTIDGEFCVDVREHQHEGRSSRPMSGMITCRRVERHGRLCCRPRTSRRHD